METLNPQEITITEIDSFYKTEFAKLVEEYGCASSVPNEARHIVSEKARALYAIHANVGKDIAEVLRQYSVDYRVWGSLIGEQISQEELTARKQKRSDKYAVVTAYCGNHIFEQVTTQQIADIGGFSYPTALKFIEDRPDVFRKLKRGLFEIRDPKSDRSKEK
jgi:hypothetical protein